MPETLAPSCSPKLIVGALGDVPPLPLLPPLLSGATLTVAVWLAEPPAPVQVSVKLVVALSAPVSAVPLAAWLPFHEPPLDVQEDAPVLDQVSVLLAPVVTDVGLAVKFTVGAAIGCEQLLPSPVGVQLAFVVSRTLSISTFGALPISLNVYCPAVRLALMAEEDTSVFTHPQLRSGT